MEERGVEMEGGVPGGGAVDEGGMVDEEVEEGLPPSVEGVHPRTLEQNNPWIINYVLGMVTDVVRRHGWPVLVAVVVVAVLWSKYGGVVWRRWRRRRDDEQEAAILKKDPSAWLTREEGRQAALARMQETYAEDTRAHALWMKHREEEKQQQRVEAWDTQQRGDGGSRHVTPPAPVAAATTAAAGTPDKPKRPVTRRPEYNPLMGGDVSRFRPERRSGASGG